MKTCRKCEQTLPSGDFYANNRNKDGLTSYCKPCSKKAAKGWLSENQYGRTRNNFHKQMRKYGLKPSDYERMVEEQGDACRICGVKGQETRHGRLSVDHCHKSGKVRGLLCPNCNSALGLLGDNCATLESAITYLKSHGH